MNIYHYSRNGEYTHASTARPDPLNPNEFLIPAHATAEMPPTAGANQVSTWDGSVWILRDDYRGYVGYDQAGEERRIEYLGVTPDAGWTLTRPVFLDEVKKARLDVLKTACSAAINAGFVSSALGSAHRYDTDKPTDQLNLIGAGLGGVDLPFTCTDLATETKQQRPHTALQLAQVYTEASAEKVRLLGVLDAARTALNAIVITTTLTAALVEVDAVTADFSLPS